MNNGQLNKIRKSINELDQKSFVFLMELLDDILDQNEIKLLKEMRASKKPSTSRVSWCGRY
jgi:hypothetical protein